MKTLQVFDQDIEISHELSQNDLYYCLSSQKWSSGTCINDGHALRKVALELKRDYCDWIYSLRNLFTRAGLIHDRKLSLYFISDLANKRAEVHSTFSALCHITLLKDLIQKNNIEVVRLVGCQLAFVDAFRSAIEGAEIQTQNTRDDVKFGFFKRAIVFGKYYFDYFLKLVFLRASRVSETKTDVIENLFFSLFPIHWSDEGDIKYSSFQKERDVSLLSLSVDGMHQYLSIFEFSSVLQKLKRVAQDKNVIVLDSAVCFQDVIQGYFRHLTLQQKMLPLLQERFQFQEIDVSHFIAQELNLSFKRIPRLLMHEAALKRIFKRHQVKRFYYYLNEFPVGRFLTYVVQQTQPATETIGYQHGGPITKLKLTYALSKGEISLTGDWLTSMRQPESILCEDTLSRERYQEAGYENIEVMEEVSRYAYLSAVERDAVRKDCSLVALGLYDGEAMFWELLDEMKENQTRTYYLRPHPKEDSKWYSKQIESQQLKNVELAEGDLVELLNVVEEVVTTSSSLGFEAYQLKIPTRVVTIPSSINDSPLFDLDET